MICQIAKELEGLEKEKAEIHIDLHKTALKIPNWKTPGHVGKDGVWFKKFTTIHDRWALEMNRCHQKAHVPEWMTKGKNTLIQKGPLKITDRNNWTLITCLPMMWKILTAQLREEINNLLKSHGLFPEEQKECRKVSRGSGELLYIVIHLLNESKTRRGNLTMAWIDDKKAYDVVTQN